MTCTCPVESLAASAAESSARRCGDGQRARRDADGRPHLRRIDGAAQEGRLLLMATRTARRRPVAVARRPLRFLTAGSVDDGKSTLIGRLLLDSRAILADQLDALEAKAGGGQPIDLALLTDGLEAEREQGITIDVAYRYFATRERKFIIADAPGHEQYTRNMVTAAAGSDAAVVLVDATKLDLVARDAARSSLPQTRRHALLASCCACRTSSSPSTSSTPSPIRAPRSRAFAPRWSPSPPRPASRRRASCRSRRCTATTSAGRARSPTTTARRCSRCSSSCRARVAATGRAGAGAVRRRASRRAAPAIGSRVLWGRVARGEVAVGAELVVFPSGETARVAELHAAGGRVASVGADRSVGVVLDRQLDVSRGDWLATPGSGRADGALSRHARLARQRAGDRRPQVLAAPRQPLAAGPHRRDRKPARHHDARRARRATRSASTTSARSWSRRSSRCRSSASPTIASPARCSSSIRRRTGPAARCSSANSWTDAGRSQRAAQPLRSARRSPPCGGGSSLRAVDLVEHAAVGEVRLLRLGPAAEDVVDREQRDLRELRRVLRGRPCRRSADRSSSPRSPGPRANRGTRGRPRRPSSCRACRRPCRPPPPAARRGCWSAGRRSRTCRRRTP